MPKVHSHYDNLKIARDASIEDIRLAYRGLTRRFHPDRNPGDANAERVMAMVNVAYSVLSDPKKRAEHDAWLAAEEAPPVKPVRHGTTLHRPSTRFQEALGVAPRPQEAGNADFDRRFRGHVIRQRYTYGIGAVALLIASCFGIWNLLNPSWKVFRSVPAVSGSPLRDEGPVAVAAIAVARYDRPSSAPNGQPWPTQSGYIEGYPKVVRGQARVLVDNSENDVDMLVKLVEVDGSTPTAVRTLLVKGHNRFMMEGVVNGTYELRYRNLANGSLSRSPVFFLEEVSTPQGVQHGSATLPLYASVSGNMLSFALNESDF